MNTDKERGQVLLIIILVMVIVLTIGLSVASRSITNLRTSREEASSQKSLAAAEAGIEQLIKSNIVATIVNPSFAPNTGFTASSNFVLGREILLYGGNIVSKDEGADIWLVPHNADNIPNFSSPWSGSLNIYWGDTAAACSNAALEIIVVYDIPSPKFKRYAYDPCPIRKSNNNFTAASGGGIVAGKTFFHSTSIIGVTSGLIARVVPLYASSNIGVKVTSGPDLPSQGIKIDSIGDSGGTKRKINVFKGYPLLPIQYFSYGLFSP